MRDYNENYQDIISINTEDFSVQDLHLDEALNVYQLSIDTISNKIWQGKLVRDLNTYEIIGNLKLLANYDVFSVFSCPKFNYIYGSFGNYLLIFDLNTHDYLGKIKVGSSPDDIVIDYLENSFYTKEGSNAEFTLFHDYKLNEIPKAIKNIELYDRNFEGHEGYKIIPDRNEIVWAGHENIFLYNYETDSLNTFPLGWSRAIEIDQVGQRIFIGQARNFPGEIHTNKLFVLDYNLNALWDLVVPMANSDLEYDDVKYLYYHSLESVYYPGGNKIYKIDTESKQIIDSIKIGYSIAKIEYSKELNRLYALNNHSYINGNNPIEFPGRLYVIDCDNMECIDSTIVPGARIGYLAESIETMFIYADGCRLICYDIKSDSIISEQLLPDGIDPMAINMNQVTNTLCIVDKTIGGVYKYWNDTLPGPIPPAAPDPPILEVGDNQIVISWESNNTIAAYNLYCKKENEDWTCVTYKPVIDTFYKDLNLINNIEYSYALSLLGEYYIEGEKSAVVTGIPIYLPDFKISRVYSDNICSNDGKDALFTFRINKESLFNDTITFTLENIPVGISIEDPDLKIYDEDFLSVKLVSDGTAEKGNYTVTLLAEGGGQTHTLDLSLQIIDQIDITIDYNPKDLNVGDWISIEGSTYPLQGKQVIINILSSNNQLLEQDTILSKGNGVFSTEYISLESDTVFVSASLIDYPYRSDTLAVYIRPGDVSVSCVADVNDSTGIGWNVQITGMVFPNPRSGTIKLQITSPFDSTQIIDNIPVNEFGYYGHTFKPDTAGLWKIVAYYSGNENYVSATSHTNFVPIGIGSGYSIIFIGDVSSESDALDTTFRNLGKYAYNVLLDRHLGKDEIHLVYPDINADLDGNGQDDDVDGTSDISSLKAAFEWAKTAITDSLDLTLYLVSSWILETFR